MFFFKDHAENEASHFVKKKQKIFFCTPVSKFKKILTLNICNESKQIYPKKKEASRKRYSRGVA